MERLAELDLEVLAALLAATGSSVLALCVNPVQDVVAHMLALRAAMYRAPETNVAAYRLVLGQIRRREPALAAAIDRELAARDEQTLLHIAQSATSQGR